jgi:hypothetical protein
VALGIPSAFVIELCSKLYILTVRINVNSLSNDVTFNSLSSNYFSPSAVNIKALEINGDSTDSTNRHTKIENKYREKVNAEDAV